jgi:hypothetical protein
VIAQSNDKGGGKNLLLKVMNLSFGLGLRQLIIPPLMEGTKGGWSAFSFTPARPPSSPFIPLRGHEMQYLYLLAQWAVLSCNSNMGMITSKSLEEIVGALYHRNNLTEWSYLSHRYERVQDYKKRNSLAF